jgi:hypothetical protein
MNRSGTEDNQYRRRHRALIRCERLMDRGPSRLRLLPGAKLSRAKCGPESQQGSDDFVVRSQGIRGTGMPRGEAASYGSRQSA